MMSGNTDPTASRCSRLPNIHICDKKVNKLPKSLKIYFRNAVHYTTDGIVLVFVQKITFILRKINQKLLQAEVLFLAQICTESFVG